jgi:hypothetical protein
MSGPVCGLSIHDKPIAFVAVYKLGTRRVVSVCRFGLQRRQSDDACAIGDGFGSFGGFSGAPGSSRSRRHDNTGDKRDAVR